jgi:hypothetical protein
LERALSPVRLQLIAEGEAALTRHGPVHVVVGRIGRLRGANAAARKDSRGCDHNRKSKYS